MSERVKVLLYTLVASGVLWLAVERFVGTTDEYASTLNIRTMARSETWDPEDEVINPAAPTNPGARRGESVETPGPAESSGVTEVSGEDESAEEDESPPERADGYPARVRADSDGDMAERTVSVAGMSAEEAALLERIDPDLLRARVPTRALDLSLVGCVPAPEGLAGTPGGASVTSAVASAAGVADERAAVTDASRGAEGSVRPDVTVGVRFRHESIAIKGTSLTRIDRLVGAFRDCATGLLVIEHNPEGRVDVADDERLMTRREEELKYYLLQRRVPKDLMRFPERP